MFDYSSLDVARLAHDITTLIADCIRLKKALRSTWTRPMAAEQRLLVQLRRRLTARFVLLAWSRGRVHLQGVLHGVGARERSQTVALRLAPEYASASEVSS